MTDFLYCHFCHKCVSTGFVPIPTDTPDEGLILRAIVVCPECIETGKVLIPDTK
jgi:hypothetical protein